MVPVTDGPEASCGAVQKRTAASTLPRELTLLFYAAQSMRKQTGTAATMQARLRSMRVLLSTIGSRGDVQLILALAMKLKELGQEARICAPPDFREFVENLGIEFAGVGP